MTKSDMFSLQATIKLFIECAIESIYFDLLSYNVNNKAWFIKILFVCLNDIVEVKLLFAND